MTTRVPRYTSFSTAVQDVPPLPPPINPQWDYVLWNTTCRHLSRGQFIDGEAKSSQSTILPILIPVAIALGLYLVLFHVLVPTWRAHRERYRQYLPLHGASSLTSRLPHVLQPSTIGRGISSVLLRIFFPTSYALRQASAAQQNAASNGTTVYRASSVDGDSDDDEAALFTAESGEAMTNVPHAGSDPRDLNRRRRENMERYANRNMAYARAMEEGEDNRNATPTGGLVGGAMRPNPDREVHPETRLNRELEAGFRDDSDEDEEDDDGRGVTVGRRSFSANR
ncbi:uncharacterized protein AB675_9338 [Cyphellophora attinorum]|uniref:Uncharacterized protein n=1 Tax=Cyphellophora attinorum TaxID=1664694 RepID=A0A0N0NNM6_9EURO|nr:uncharacterized protein AB675_9338 [Phialophora attinorum]KPI41718.1 hypothetical protein AB675_9338 [Phialophora attinorum]